MAAGQGFKTFTTGEVLTAADTNGYLMQGVLVFADAAARTAAIASPQEGQTSYLKDTDEIQVYSGSAWVTKSGSLPSQTGNSGKYLTTDGTNTSWGTVAGGMTLLSTTTLTGSTVTISSISGSYKNLVVVIKGANSTAGGYFLNMRLNGDTGTNYSWGQSIYNGAAVGYNGIGNTVMSLTELNTVASGVTYVSDVLLTIPRYTDTSGNQLVTGGGWIGNVRGGYAFGGIYTNRTAAITSITFNIPTTTFAAGTVYLYGVN